MHKVNFYTINESPPNQGVVTHQIVDQWAAYLQYLDQPNYRVTCDITVSEYTGQDLDQTEFNVLLHHMPDDSILQLLDTFDVVFIDNGTEPVSVCSTQTIGDLLNNKQPNVYFQLHSYFYNRPDWNNNILWERQAFHEMFKEFYCSPFYPTFYSQRNANDTRNGITYINGRNKSVRQHFFLCIGQQCPGVNLHNVLSSGVYETFDSVIETVEDTEFKDLCNTIYTIKSQQDWTYYADSILPGRQTPEVNNTRGDINPGCFLLPYYYENNCIVYPETVWINDEFALTEKSWKCFIAGVMPFPVAGAHFHQMMHDNGYYSAWSLLPDELKQWDNECDHQLRHIAQADAVAWLYDNQWVFAEDKCKEMILSNFHKFFAEQNGKQAVEKLDKIITQHYNSKFNEC